MSQMRIFLSHSSQDKAFADALVRALRGAGADVWYDEHNLGTGQLLDVITRELQTRPVFIVLLSKAAFASAWVRDECRWAYNLYKREPQRFLLPVVAASIDHSDFNTMLYLEDIKRIEGPGDQPYPQAEAIELVQRELALTPRSEEHPSTQPQPAQSIEDLIAHGKALLAQGQYAYAISFLERATESSPSDFSAWYDLGVAHIAVKHWREAEAAFRRAVDAAQHNAVAWYHWGLALAALTRDEEAMQAFGHAFTVAPQYHNALRAKNILRHISESGEQWTEPQDQLVLLALSNNPRWVNMSVRWRTTAREFARIGRHDAALAAYNLVLYWDPANGGVWLSKADSLRALGRLAEAQDALRRAKELFGR